MTEYNAGRMALYAKSTMVADDPVELDEQRYYTDRMGAGRATWVGQAIKMPPKDWDFKAWIKSMFGPGNAFTLFSNYRCIGTFIIPDVTKNAVRMDCYFSRPTLDYTFFGDVEDVEAAMKWMTEIGFTDPISDITWVFGTEDRMQSLSLPLDIKPTLYTSFPWLPCGLAEYVQRFLDSSESILVLLGPPGTGKTSFIKELVHRSKYPATVSYTPALLQTDGMFANFVSQGEKGLLVMEDSDSFLTPRTADDGHKGMHRLLNVADGIVSLRRKKLVFTTNLEVDKIDTALIRPGRCFDVVTTRPLTREEAVAVRAEAKMDPNGLPDGKEFTLAEALKHREDRSVQSRTKVGFLS
jgi:hypothetical protein